MGVATDAATDPNGDPAGNAQAVAHLGNTVAQQQALNEQGTKAGHPNLLHRTLGWFSRDVEKPAAHILADVVNAPGVKQTLNLAGAPLREVQHQYRYLHDVEARHGPIYAVLAALPFAAGAGVGGYYGGYQGGKLGAEAVGLVSSHLLYKDSYARTEHGADYQGRYNRETGQYEGPKGQVSIGRDVADLAGAKPGTGGYGVSSGAADFLADLVLDPLASGGKLYADAKSAEGAGGQLATRFSRAPQGATNAIRVSDLETRVAKLPTVDRAFRDIAGMDAGQVVASYPKLAALSPQLGEADTVDKVVDVFRNALMTNEMVTETLPSMSLTRVPFAQLGRVLRAHEGIGANPIRSVSSLLPTYFDPETLSLSNKGFKLGDPGAVRGVYQTMRFSQSHEVATDVADRFAAAIDNPGEQIRIYKNGVRSMLVAAGLPEDSPFVTATVDEVAQRSMGGGDAIYGMDQEGRNISKVATGSGDSSLAILQSQVGMVAFPDFSAVTREVRNLNTFKSFYGAADDWMYNKFTQGIFKRLVLLSGGFAQRIAAAETIPAALREGVGNLIRSRLSASAAKDMGEEELGHLSAAVAKVMGGADKVVGDADKTEFVANLMHDNGGHIVAPAIDTTTPSAEVGSAGERASRTIYNAYKQVPDKYKLGDKYGFFGRADEHYIDAWGRWLSPISADEPSQLAARAYLDAARAGQSAEDATQAGVAAAKEWLDAQPDRYINRYGRHAADPGDATGVDPHQAWAETIMDNVKGATHAPLDVGGAPHMGLLKNVADGAQTNFAELEKIPDEIRPLQVPGRQYLPDTSGKIERIANVGFRKVLDPIINFISREPLYVNEAYRQYKYLKPLVDSGDMLAEDARQLAQVRAVNGVLPFIHNTLERSQFSSLARNFMPFYFAQEQAYKRFGRIFADDPGAFRRFQLMISGLHEVGSTERDPNGQSFLRYPGAGFLDGKVSQILGRMGVPVQGSVPVSFSGQLKSLNTIFPFSEGVRPQFGPVVAIPSHLIENMFPELTPAVHGLIGDQAASGSIYDQLIPNQFVKSVVQDLDPSMRSRSMQNATMNTIQYFAHRQQVAMDKWVADGNDPNSPDAPQIVPRSTTGPEWQTFLDRVKNQTRITFLFKSLLGAVTPAAPITNVGDWNLRADLRKMIAEEGITAAIPAFLDKHPDAQADTVFLSKSNAGASIPATQVGQDWINKNMGFLHKYPNAGAWFVPQTPAAFSQGVYNEQMAQHLRMHKSPEQVMNDIYVAAGNNLFYNRLKPEYDRQLAAAKVAGDKTKAAAIQHGFSLYIQNVIGPQNPVWWDDLNSADRQHNRTQAVQQMQEMFANGDVPDSPQTAVLASMLRSFQQYQDQLAARRSTGATAAQLKARWQAFVDQVAAKEPTLQPVIQSVFREM